MSELGGAQIPMPQNEQDFEDCNVVLWRCILNDDNVKRHGRRGQRQHGVDIVGCREGRPKQIVGIQCKLKGEGRKLTEDEVREEVEKALTFEPPLCEYIIVTTAPDDTKLESLARQLSISVSKDRGKNLKIDIYGWENLQQRIRQFPEAVNAFDPSHTPQADRIERKFDEQPAEFAAIIAPQLDAIQGDIASLRANDVRLPRTAFDSEYHQLIDAIRELLPTNPNAALELLLKLQSRLDEDVPNHIRFRVASNIAACHFELGDEEKAANGFIAAWNLSPDDPAAIANKAFGFLLLKDWQSVKTFAESMLSENPHNAALAAYYIRGLKNDELVVDPIAQVPETVRKTPQVAEAHIAWLMDRGAPGAWIDAATAAHSTYPDSGELEEVYACALLSRAIGGDRFVHSHVLEDAALADIDKAIEIYESRWPEVRDRKVHRRGDQTSIALNLMVAYRLRGRNEESTKTANDALERFPDEVMLKEHAAVIFFEKRDTKRALELISDLVINEQIASLRLNIGIVEEDWDSVADVVDNHLECFPESVRSLARASRILARVETAPTDERRSILEADQCNFEGDTRALTLLAQTARLNQLDDLSKAYFKAATSAFSDGDNSPSSRRYLAAEAMARQELNVVVDALWDHVRLDRYSEQLRMLGHALVYYVPIRQRAMRFFEGLAHELRSLPYFQQLEGVCLFNRGIPQDAVGRFSAALEQEPCLETIIYLIRSLVVTGDRDSIVSLLERDAVDELPGSPLERIEFSNVLSEFGEPARAIDLGYEAVTCGLDNPDIVRKYLVLVLNSTWDQQDHSFDGMVATGVWVHVTETNGKESKGLVGESENRPWGEKIEPTNAFFAKSLGLKTGDVFEHVNNVGVAEKWRVSEIKPRWLQAFHHLVESFGQRFPDAPGFGSMTIANDDIEPILEQVRRQSQAAGVRAELYLENGLPIAVAAGDTSGGGIDFAQYLYSAGMQVRVCSGTAEEFKEALALVKDHRRSGAVLDALTAWHAAALDIFPVLKECLGSLAIPASELGRIKAMTAEFTCGGGGRSISLGYRNGQFIRYTETDDERADRLNELKLRISKIEETCEVEPIEFPDHFSELGEFLVGLTPRDAFAPAVMAGKKRLLLCEDMEPIEFPDHFSELGEFLVGLTPRDAFAPAVMAGKKRLLLCEDMMMRQLAGKAFGAKGVWLQAVLMSAEQEATMSHDLYSDAVVYLAAHRHGHISLNAQVLLSAFERDESPDLSNLQALCTYIGHTGADLQSHVALGAGFIDALWTSARPIVLSNVPVDSKTLKATDLVFRALIGDTNKDEWPKRAAALFRNLDEAAALYLFQWCEAKFLPVDQIRKILRDEVD